MVWRPAVKAALRPSLYRTIRVVMADGATFRVPSSTRLVGDALRLERDPSNHPLYLGNSDQGNLLSRREEARLERVKKRDRSVIFD